MFAASGVTEKTESHYFYKLLKLRKKIVRYQHHHDFIQSCQRNNVFPDGLQLRKTANIGIVSPDFEDKWSKILKNASGGLRDLISEEVSLALDSFEKDVVELETEIATGFGVEILDKFNAKVREICAKLEQSLIGRRLTKFDKLASSTMETLYLDDTVYSDTAEQQAIDGQVGSFIDNIGRHVDRAQQFSPVIVEDLGAEESLSDINPLPGDSPMILMEVLEENISGDGNDQWSRGLDSCMSLTLDGTVNRSVHNIPADTNGLSVDDMALLLVDLMGEQCSGDVPEYLPSREPSQLFSHNESTEGNITIEESRVIIESPPLEHIGMGVMMYGSSVS